MQPSPYELTPSSSCCSASKRFFSDSSTRWTSTRLICIFLIFPLIFLLIVFTIIISPLDLTNSTNPSKTVALTNAMKEGKVNSADYNLRRHRNDARLWEKRASGQEKDLPFDQKEVSIDRSKREVYSSPVNSSIPVSPTASPSSTSSSNPDSFRTNSTTTSINSTSIPDNISTSSDNRVDMTRPEPNRQSVDILTRNAGEIALGNETSNPPMFEEAPIASKESGGQEGLLRNASHCIQFTEEQLVKELKQHGTYNPDFMAWDVRGVLNFFERTTTDNYDKLKKTHDRAMTVEQNLAAVEQLVKELNLQNCNLRTPDVLARLYNLSSSIPPRSSSTLDSSLGDYGRLRTKRDESDHVNPTLLAKAKYVYDLYTKHEASRDDTSDVTRSTGHPGKKSSENDDVVGQVHLVPSGCRKRGASEDGYLRLCSACQAIRRLPDSFFPPFLNEVTCDEDKACLYFYDYPHGKCRQKHLNLVVLKNVGTSECQLWKRYNINVRVSCECFVDEMSFFAKYV